ncbi:hypothetical protein CEF57_07615 [Salmonella enterica]|nr:hypothetical protein [Salmonella enterica]EFU7807523.1 hypothetical protein [Salmonella enterica]EGW7286158.1 hypothetical protein [Salmonella enterica]EHL8408578.1 hypothetical protein [Salmonella enterica]
MGSNIIELAKLGHERAAELKASCGAVDVRSLAQLISDLATQLEVQFVRSTNMAVQLANAESKCRELAAENVGLKAAFDKPQAYLSWHAIPPTWEDPLPCGEYLDVHDDAGHKNSDGTDCWPVFAKPEIKTQATDAFLAEVRAQGVDALAQTLDGLIAVSVTRSYITEFAAQLRKGAEL